MMEKFFILEDKFTIAFENTISSGYTTEKLTQPMSIGSIPIYFGNPNVSKEFNSKSFINAHEFKNLKDVVKRVIEIDENEEEYLKMRREPFFMNNKPNKYFDEKRLLKRFEEIFK